MNFQPIFTPEVKVLHEQFRLAVEKLVIDHQIAIDGLTEQQLVSALKQVIQCGDFQKFVVGTSDAQQVIYVPFAREQELEAKIQELKDEVDRLQKFHVEDMRVTNESATFHMQEATKMRNMVTELEQHREDSRFNCSVVSALTERQNGETMTDAVGRVCKELSTTTERLTAARMVANSVKDAFLGISGGNLTATAWQLSLGKDNGGLERPTLAAQLRSIGDHLLRIEAALTAYSKPPTAS